jgi:hypothetical protein
MAARFKTCYPGQRELSRAGTPRMRPIAVADLGCRGRARAPAAPFSVFCVPVLQRTGDRSNECSDAMKKWRASRERRIAD